VSFERDCNAVLGIPPDAHETAIKRLKTLATRFLDLGEIELARAALLEAGRLAETGSLSPAGRKRIRSGTGDLGILPREVCYA